MRRSRSGRDQLSKAKGSFSAVLTRRRTCLSGVSSPGSENLHAMLYSETFLRTERSWPRVVVQPPP